MAEKKNVHLVGLFISENMELFIEEMNLVNPKEFKDTNALSVKGHLAKP